MATISLYTDNMPHPYPTGSDAKARNALGAAS